MSEANSSLLDSGHKTLGVPIVREPKEWKLRLDLLKETINKFLENIPEKEVTNEFLFYDSCVAN